MFSFLMQALKGSCLCVHVIFPFRMNLCFSCLESRHCHVNISLTCCFRFPKLLVLLLIIYLAIQFGSLQQQLQLQSIHRIIYSSGSYYTRYIRTHISILRSSNKIQLLGKKSVPPVPNYGCLSQILSLCR